MVQDPGDGALHVQPDVLGGDAQDRDAPPRQPGVTAGVALWVSLHLVREAVDLDSQTCGVTVAVSYTHLTLPTKRIV